MFSAKMRKWCTSGYLNIWETEDLQISTAALGGALSNINENKFIHFTLDET